MLDLAYTQAIQFTKSHYENFPVISFFIPKKLRKHIAVVYQFARQADDIADEGIFTKEMRLEKLSNYRRKFGFALSERYENPFWQALYNTIKDKHLTSQYFLNLLDAFEQDIVKNRFNDFSEILNYCSKSANPVGRIILELFGVFDEESIEYSDAICTALQLTNFYQDTKKDFEEKGRIYLPKDEMLKYGVDENIFSSNETNPELKMLMKYQINRTRDYFTKGNNLFAKLPRNLKRQIILTVKGGEAILNKIEASGFDVLRNRPILSNIDYLKIVINSFR